MIKRCLQCHAFRKRCMHKISKICQPWSAPKRKREIELTRLCSVSDLAIQTLPDAIINACAIYPPKLEANVLVRKVRGEEDD